MTIDTLKIFECGELNCHPSLGSAHGDAHPRVEVLSEQLLELQQAGRAQAWGLARVRADVERDSVARRGRGRRPRSSRTVQMLGDRPAGQLLLEGAVRRAEQRAGVAGG